MWARLWVTAGSVTQSSLSQQLRASLGRSEPPPNPRTSPMGTPPSCGFFLARLLSSPRLVASSSTLYCPSASPKPIEKRPSPMHVIAPFSRCVHSCPIPLRARGDADGETPFLTLFLRPTPSIDIN